MRRELVMTMTAFALCAAGCENGVPVERAEEPIVGGQDAPEGALPWMVALFGPAWSDDDLPADRHWCGGTLIDAQRGYVITAAHCVTAWYPVPAEPCEDEEDCEDDVELLDGALPPGTFEVTIGSHRMSAISDDDLLDVVEVIVHPDYDSDLISNDIALLRVDGVDPAIPTPRVIGDRLYDPFLILPGVSATVAGWGALGEDDGYPDVLQWVRVPIVERSLCNFLLSDPMEPETVVTEDMLCAAPLRGGRDSCGGDSGGPLTVRDLNGHPVLAGVVSWGDGCAQRFKPGVYSNVLALRAFIDACTAESASCDHLPEIPEGFF